MAWRTLGWIGRTVGLRDVGSKAGWMLRSAARVGGPVEVAERQRGPGHTQLACHPASLTSQLCDLGQSTCHLSLGFSVCKQGR